MGEVTVRPVARQALGYESGRDDGWGSVGAVIRLDGGQSALQDAVDAAGTPVLGLEPYPAESGPRGEVPRPAWSAGLMRAHHDGEAER
ncbi:hypothetical protein [Kitasatospora sp. NPDC017646]|uniref:hypothetical protein n=1 Tax=Kitasatospora sp. NPDC017646 TaxID=3364024 RepID=UPI0037A780EC